MEKSVSSVLSLSPVQLYATPWTIAWQVSHPLLTPRATLGKILHFTYWQLQQKSV